MMQLDAHELRAYFSKHPKVYQVRGAGRGGWQTAASSRPGGAATSSVESGVWGLASFGARSKHCCRCCTGGRAECRTLRHDGHASSRALCNVLAPSLPCSAHAPPCGPRVRPAPTRLSPPPRPGPQGGWRNLARAAWGLEASRYRPIASVPRITAPVLYITAVRDSVCPPDVIEAAVAMTKDAAQKVMQCSHFDVYQGQPFEEAVAAEVEFLAAKLGARGGGGGGGGSDGDSGGGGSGGGDGGGAEGGGGHEEL